MRICVVLVLVTLFAFVMGGVSAHPENNTTGFSLDTDQENVSIVDDDSASGVIRVTNNHTHSLVVNITSSNGTWLKVPENTTVPANSSKDVLWQVIGENLTVGKHNGTATFVNNTTTRTVSFNVTVLGSTPTGIFPGKIKIPLIGIAIGIDILAVIGGSVLVVVFVGGWLVVKPSTVTYID